jgi:hypothetical protein
VWTPGGQLQSYTLNFTPNRYGGLGDRPQPDILYMGGAFRRVQGVAQPHFAEIVS